MTYCVGVLLEEGLVMASDSRTNAGVDNFSQFCKMTTFERAGDRVIVLLSSGSLAGTQAVVSLLKQRASLSEGVSTIWTVRTLFDVALLVSDALRDIEKRDAPFLEGTGMKFNASFILGGQIQGESPRLFRIYAEGNFIEAGDETPFLQTGEAKYGKPLIDRVITPATSITEATKCVLVSFDSTMRSNLSVGMPIDLLCYERDSLVISKKRRFPEGDSYFTNLSTGWSAGVRQAFRDLPDLAW
ncbi:peptidase [Cyanobium sp. ATX 6A2]|uniref:peptidase n=1 Tax=Cyanobium sp. ATX 6A2 TaxID=2823700 RepID=UPI0037BEA2D7|nr:peptidase [Cyanobium sp. ATX 6A2]